MNAVNPPDPKMKAALAEIMAIIKANNLAGAVFLQSDKNLEYQLEIAPSWSCAFFESPDATGMSTIRFKSMGKDYPTVEAQREAVEATTGMVIAFESQLHEWAENFRQVLGMLGRHFINIEHWEKRR